MPRKRPPYVELWRDRHRKVRVYFRKDKGPRIPLPDAIGSEEFEIAYNAALLGQPVAIKSELNRTAVGSLSALIVSYKKSMGYADLRASSKKGYTRRLEAMRIKHGHRSVRGLTRERIETGILSPLADTPGTQLDTLKKLRILVQHAMTLTKGDPLRLDADPSVGITRPKSKEIRAWTDAETAAFERRWPIGTKPRTAYALMLNVGTARIDVHAITWAQFEAGGVSYTRVKTGIGVDMATAVDLQQALAAAKRDHVCILTTAYGRPFTVAGFSGWMRAAMTKAGLPLDCKPHGLRKTLGRRLADAGCTAHEIMAMLGHKTLGEAERYTREADRRLGGRQAVLKLEKHTANRNAQTDSPSLGETEKTKGTST